MNNYSINVSPDLQLKLLTKNDALEFFTCVNKNKNFLLKWMHIPREIKSVHDSIQKINQYNENFKTESIEFGIFKNNTFIGQIGAHTLYDQTAEIRYWLDEDHTGKGIIVECIKNFIEYCFSETNTFRIVAKIDTENIKSKNAIEKAGFHYEGTERAGVFFKGEPRNLLIYSYLVSDKN